MKIKNKFSRLLMVFQILFIFGIGNTASSSLIKPMAKFNVFNLVAFYEYDSGTLYRFIHGIDEIYPFVVIEKISQGGEGEPTKLISSTRLNHYNVNKKKISFTTDGTIISDVKIKNTVINFIVTPNISKKKIYYCSINMADKKKMAIKCK